MSEAVTKENTSKEQNIFERSKGFWVPDNLLKLFEKEVTEATEAGNQIEPYNKGLFLEKLWSAVHYLFEVYGSKGLITAGAIQRLNDLYNEIFHQKGIKISRKVELAKEIRELAEGQGLQYSEFYPDAIEENAHADEQAAIEELKTLKSEPPPFWVERNTKWLADRKEKFSPELDVSKIPPWTARATLEDYKRLAKKREPEKK